MDPDLTVEEAKRTAMSIELELVDLLPAEHVEAVDQLQVGGFFGCGTGDRVVQWTGHTTVLVSPDFDIDAAVDRVVEQFADREGFTAERETSALGGPRAHIVGEFGAGYLLGEAVEDRTVQILSFSPCFTLPEGMSGRTRY